VERITRPFLQFLRIESASGIVLAACTLLALSVANSPLGEGYARFWDATFSIRLGSLELSYPLWYWINDGLMTIFFFVIGLEIKRELVWGELSDRRRVALPVIAALGGVLAPIAVYLALQRDPGARSGWAVPMATDIAFVIGCLAFLGKRVPHGLKVFIISLAIVDDILAVLVIAIFFSGSIDVGLVGWAAGGFVLCAVLNRAGVRTVSVYVFVGAGIWLATLKSGVHPTVAGVLLGLMTPAAAWIGEASLLEILDSAGRRLRGASGSRDADEGKAALGGLEVASREAISPLERLEAALHPWVSFGIMPLFALANAGIPIRLGSLGDATAVAVAAGLAAGKPIGITLSSWIAVRLGLASLPERVSWPAVLGCGMLGGIGFTMALFIASLALTGEDLHAAKSGILLGSAASAILGFAVLVRVLPRGGDPRS
jgi:NhaA family Na+:H+ antiporter